MRGVHEFDNGVRVYDDHLISIQRERYEKRNVHEAEEEDIFIEVIRAIPAQGCYVSIGSAIGYYPILAKKLSPGLTIHAVEPLEHHRRCFAENIGLNGLSLDDFVIHDEGVSSSEGTERFIAAGYGSALVRNCKRSRSFVFAVKRLLRMALAHTGVKTYQTIPEITEIRTTTLDNLMKVIDEPANLLQMDVQGFEVEVLMGASHSLDAGSVETFLIGTHGRKRHQSCLDILERHDYCIEFEEPEPTEQPDGIVLASKDVRRLFADSYVLQKPKK